MWAHLTGMSFGMCTISLCRYPGIFMTILQWILRATSRCRYC